MTAKTRKPRKRAPATAPKLRYPTHSFAKGPDPERCGQCPLPPENRVHDLSRLPQMTAEQHAAEARRLGERED